MVSILWTFSSTILLFSLCSVFLRTLSFETEDIWTPGDCDSVVKPGDHLLLEYSLLFENGTTAVTLAAPSPLLYTTVSEGDDYIVQRGLKGMCKNATRKITWTGEADSVSPLELPTLALLPSIRSAIVTVVHLTEPEDFDIFRHLNEVNSTGVYGMLTERRGALAVNEWGDSPLMIAVRNDYLSAFSYFINARKPMIDINFAKSSGHTALFYAVPLKLTSMVKALLQRGGPHSHVEATWL